MTQPMPKLSAAKPRPQRLCDLMAPSKPKSAYIPKRKR